MLCKKPFMAGLTPFPCRQCLPCRINKARMWSSRQFFEGLMHKEKSFVTLTYATEKLPDGGNLDPRHLQLFLKRLRFAIAPLRVRFFAVGEYGEENERPHYHLSLFGMQSDTIVGSPKRFGRRAIEECWGMGRVQVAEYNERTALYVAGYTVKKMTAAGDVRLKGRTPEFMRSSRKPGLGADAMDIIAKQLLTVNYLGEHSDVPRQVMVGKKMVPLGSYLLRKLRESTGMESDYIKEVKDAISYERSLDLLALYKANGKYEGSSTVKYSELPEIAQRILQAEMRYKLWDKKKETLQ